MRVYILNRRVTRNNLDDISDSGFCMQYSDTTGVIIYWKSNHNFFIHRAHDAWFDEYISSLSIEDAYTPGSLLLQNILKSYL